MNSRSAVWRALRTALLVAAVLAALGHASGWAPLRFVTLVDLAISDARLRAFMPRTLDPRIVIVDIDEKSLAEIGRWPWGRDTMAALVDELFTNQGAAVVGFDMVFAEPDNNSAFAALRQMVRRSPELGAKIGTQVESMAPEFDLDARFARALVDRNAVLGFYLTNERDARKTGVLPRSVFDSSALGGKPIAFLNWDGYASNIEVLARAAPAAGFFNNVPDPDGLVRTLPLIAQLGAGHYETLALAMFRQYTGNPAVVPVLPVQHGLPRDYDALQSVALRQPDSTTKDVHEQAIPVDARVQVQVPFRGGGGPRGGSFEYLSASDLLGHRVAKLHLDGKLVLVGTSAPGVYDQRSTPVDEVYPGVEVHANLLSGLLDDRLPVRPDWTSSFEMLQLLTIAGLLGWALPRVRAARAAQIALGLVAILIVANLWSYRSRGLILPLASSLLLTALIYFGITVWGFIVEGRSRRSLERLFGTYVPPELVVEMARDPARYDMRAENRVLTIMFCDMRNFTRVAELLSPEDLRGLVNSFFSTMTHAIREQRGTLDKYIGDAIMAFWGAPLSDPSHALHAVQAALSMIERLKTLNDELRTRKLPEIGLGIGLNTGLVCVGDMGSRMRRSYTVMGDAVNLASRIEGLTRHYGVDLLVGADTHDDVLRSINTGVGATPDRSDDGVSAGLRWVEVDRVRVKGKQQPVTLFTPITVPDQGSKAFDEEMRLWQLALTAYRLQHWDEAQARLQTLQRAYAESPFARIYQQLGVRTDNYRSTSPTLDWDGAHTFDSK